MKKSILIACFALSAVTGAEVVAGFASQSAKSSDAAMTAANTTVNEDTKTIYLDSDKLQYWGSKLNEKVNVWSWQTVSTKRVAGQDIVYFKKPSDWSTVYAHHWSDGGLGTEWPGTAMTLVEGTNNIYSISNLESHAKIVFSDNGDNTKKTGDLTIPYTAEEGICYDGKDGGWKDSYTKNQNTLLSKVENIDNMFSAEIPAGDTGAIFMRTHDWTYDKYTFPADSYVWNKTENQDISSLNCCNLISDAGALTTGEMRKYTAVENGFYFLGIDGVWTPSADNKMNLVDGVYTKDVTLKAYDEFKVANYTRGADTWYGYDELTGSAKDDGQLIKASGSTNIKVVNAGTYTPKVTVGDSVTFEIDSIEPFTHVQELRVGDTKYELIENPSQPGELMTADDVTVKSGDIISYYYDTVLQTATPKAVGNNNCWNNSGVTTVCLNMTAKIYVDISNPSAKTIFCDGIPTQETDKNVYGLSINNGYTALYDNGIRNTYDEWYTYGVTLKKDDVIKFANSKVNLSNVEVFGVGSRELGTGLSDEDFVATTEGDVKVTYVGDEDITVDIYGKFKDQANTMYICTANTDLAIAEAYAKQFNSSFKTICEHEEARRAEELPVCWALAENDFNNIESATAKAYITNADDNSNSHLRVFGPKYDFICGKYGYTNFAGRTVSTPSNPVKNINQTQVIVIITTISVLSLAALATTIAIRKKKKTK